MSGQTLSRADQEFLTIAKSRGLAARRPNADDLRRDIEALDDVLADALAIIFLQIPDIEADAPEFVHRAFNVREYTRFLLGRL